MAETTDVKTYLRFDPVNRGCPHKKRVMAVIVTTRVLAERGETIIEDQEDTVNRTIEYFLNRYPEIEGVILRDSGAEKVGSEPTR